jgi:hypothetical protein
LFVELEGLGVELDAAVLETAADLFDAQALTPLRRFTLG